MSAHCNSDELDDVLLNYVMNANPKSNEDLKRYLRRYPLFREAIIDFTATWRALSILDKVLPPPPRDDDAEQELMRRAEAQLRTAWRRRPGEKLVRNSGK
jgi:hypothetical protein